MKRSAILILDPRGNISLGGKDVVNRHLEYAKALYSKSDKHKLVVYSTSYQEKRTFYSKFMDRYILSKPTHNPVIFSWRAYRRLRKEKIEVSLIVVSDPWESFWTGFFLVKLIGRKVPIQMQIHGDIADPLWRKNKLEKQNSLLPSKILMFKSNINKSGWAESKKQFN